VGMFADAITDADAEMESPSNDEQLVAYLRKSWSASDEVVDAAKQAWAEFGIETDCDEDETELEQEKLEQRERDRLTLAAAALQGLIVRDGHDDGLGYLACCTVNITDAVLAELDRTR